MAYRKSYPTPRKGPYNKYVRAASSAYRAYRYARGAYRGPVGKMVRRLYNKKKTVSKKNVTSNYGLYRNRATRLLKFPRGKKTKRADKYALYGSVKRFETGGILNDANCVYIGHATWPHEQIVPAVCRALVRQLFKQRGNDFVSWTEGILDATGTLDLIYTYYIGPESATKLTRTINLTVNQTYLNIAETLYNDWKTNFNAQTHILDEIYLITGGAGTDVQAKVRCREFHLDIYCESTLSLQNRTLAGTGVGENDQEMTDISNNPLIGRLYNGPWNGFIPDFRDSTEVGYQGYTCNPQNGLILANAANSLTDETKKPPPGYFFGNCKKSSRAVLEPGIIRKHFIKSFKRCTLIDFMAMLRLEIDLAIVGNTEAVTKGGQAAMFGLEKALDSRQSEADISVAYEINQKYCVSGYYKKSVATVPILEIN